MADEHLGEQLVAAGWQQGALLPPVESSIYFHLDKPLTKIARDAQPILASEVKQQQTEKKPAHFHHAVASGRSRKQADRLVVITQTCDINKSPDVEPVVWAIRAFFTKNSDMLKRAGGNSKRQFLLDESRGLVAEMTNLVAIEKPVLADFDPEQGALDEATRRRFSHWIADRFERVPQPEQVVRAVIRHILDNLRQAENDNAPDVEVLQHIREVRFAKLEGDPPYNVQLVFMATQPGLSSGEYSALSRLVVKMREWLAAGGEAKLDAWDVATPADISLEDYLNTDKLDLDEYTYRGRTVRGLTPLPRT